MGAGWSAFDPPGRRVKAAHDERWTCTSRRVVYEHVHLGDEDRRRESALLQRRGYQAIAVQSDSLAVRREAMHAMPPLRRAWSLVAVRFPLLAFVCVVLFAVACREPPPPGSAPDRRATTQATRDGGSGQPLHGQGRDPSRPKLGATSDASREGPDSIFEVELWPGEGRPQFKTTGAALTLRERPARSAPVARVVPDVPPGTPIAFDHVRYQTMQPGSIAVLAPDTVSGRNMGDIRYLSRKEYYAGSYPQEDRAVVAGDTIVYLQHRAEGTCFVRIDRDVIDASPCPAHLGDSFDLVAEPQVAWWIRVVRHDAPAGWLLVGDSTVTQAGRRF